jgi:hypothetical protein
VNEFKEDTNNTLNSKKQMEEIKKILKDIEEEFNRDIEILEKSN